MKDGNTMFDKFFVVPAKKVVLHHSLGNKRKVMKYVAAVPLGFVIGIIFVIPIYVITCGGVCQADEGERMNW